MKHKSWYSEMFANEDRHWWFCARRKMVKKILDSFFQIADQNAPARILEIGCGTGGNLELLSTYGAMYAVEPNTEAREMANSRNVCLVRPGSLPDDIAFEEKFDLICALDVLEYVDDDLAAIQAIHNLLTPNGKLLLAVPAYMFLWSYHDIAVENKRRYSKTP